MKGDLKKEIFGWGIPWGLILLLTIVLLSAGPDSWLANIAFVATYIIMLMLVVSTCVMAFAAVMISVGSDKDAEEGCALFLKLDQRSGFKRVAGWVATLATVLLLAAIGWTFTAFLFFLIAMLPRVVRHIGIDRAKKANGEAEDMDADINRALDEMAQAARERGVPLRDPVTGKSRFDVQSITNPRRDVRNGEGYQPRETSDGRIEKAPPTSG